MKTNLLQICLLAAALLALPAMVQAQFTYSTINGAITITGYNGLGGAVTIPATINGLPVTGIEDQAFVASSLTSVMIPDSVTNIGFEAFYGCYSLTNVIIGNGVTSIGYNAFFDCSSLTSVTLPNSITSIGDEAFSDTALTSVTIRNGVTNIGNSAFSDCDSLTSVTIPDSVTSIGDEAFFDCERLTSINMNVANAFYSSVNGVLFNKKQTTLIQYPIGNAATSYTIPDSVTSIGDYAFANDGYPFFVSSLTSVTIGNSVTNIGDFAFQYCGSLTNVNIGNGVTSIGSGAFEDCGLTSVTIPGSVKNIEDGFHNGDPDEQAIGAFAYCANLASVTIDNGVTNIGDFAFFDCESLTNVMIGNSVTSIGDYAFAFSSLTNVTIPSSVISIGNNVFAGTALTSVTIGNGVISIGDYTFDACYGLTSVYFGGNAPTADSAAFDGDPATVYYLPGTLGWDDFSANTGLPIVQWFLPQPLILNQGPGFGMQSNQFSFTISWATNAPVTVEACSNLANPVWLPVSTNTLVGGTSYFSDPQWTNYSARFYRLRSP